MSTGEAPSNCQRVMMASGSAYPRSCPRCGLGPCPYGTDATVRPAPPVNLDRRDPTYIGDGVYVAHDGFQVWIRANDANWDALQGDVALEPVVLLALVEYAIRVGLLKAAQAEWKGSTG